jgi:hypothetical protein
MTSSQSSKLGDFGLAENLLQTVEMKSIGRKMWLEECLEAAGVVRNSLPDCWSQVSV